MTYTPEQRSLRARAAAHAMHAKHDARDTTRAARAAFYAKFERQVDPNGVLSPEERARRAASAHKAHMLKMSLKAIRKGSKD